MSELMGGPDGATPLDPDEVEGLKFKSIKTRPALDQLEAVNISSGIRWADKLKEPDLLTEQFIKELHSQLLGEVWDWAGKFRKTERNIGVDPSTIGVELRNLFDDCRTWIEFSSYEPLEIAVRFHHRLVKIHPFPNGNGRHSRIMADLICKHLLNIPAIDWSGGKNLQEQCERRTEYINALRSADGYDYQPLLIFCGG